MNWTVWTAECEGAVVAGVIFLMPRWGDPTELFLLRQIRMLTDANVLNAIVTDSVTAGVRWNGRIPVHSLTNACSSRSLLQAFRSRLSLNRFQSETQLQTLK